MNKKIIILVLSIAICFTIIIVNKFSTKLYGNDIESIQKSISKLDNITQEVTVFDIINIDDYKIAGFFEGNINNSINMGYAVFQANRHGNYVYKTYYRSKNAAIIGDRITVDTWTCIKDNNTPTILYDVIISNNLELDKVKRIVNNTSEEIIKIDHNPSITLIQSPDLSNYQCSFYFYDKNDNIIE